MRDRAYSLRYLTLSASVLLATLAAPAQAFSDDEARRAILDLRKQLQQQSEQNARARLQLADQIQSMQQEMAQLRDQIELISRHQPGPQGQGAPGNAPGGQISDPQEQAAYDGSIDLYSKGQYKDAAESLAAFIALYPNSSLAPMAQFYLGRARYATRDYKGAIEELNSMVQKAPDNERAPDALLVIAGSQIELNNRAGAKATLQRIVRDYPSSDAAATAKSRLQVL
ncbi:tol-pal system protein YbgF [Bordetella trematum]|uniref:Cell division coordinator CpoB n=1 Tax=Bordetella trematum TaxID=123899 RepID=A0A157S9K6_9BORD|nr:tol-pal system protein YbgF [Bordetella trematum]AUL48389.1 tol-pal system protein YbgF [Bordetella trematum]AZR95348.1 tol-pal system protein YbgF [Bordetella trematum]NNH17886.1 tol-pal system protein YbgF [Bordetella trematum]QIM70302.1 tol-pal system protein YbgF [Bordetella trematum]SAI35867.1 periplasmic protein [Bordetella trematum]